MNPSFEEIEKCQSVQGNVIRKTPLLHSPYFSQLTNSEIYFKSEFQQKTGSFKIRGAYYKIKSLTDEEKKKGVVAASAGNHAQGVAFASSLEKISCTIIMPKHASPAKVAATKGYGANVILEGNTYDESWAKAKEISEKTGAKIIHAFDDPQVIAAQGVIGLEILEDLPDVDEIYLPIGGGGLAAGVLIAVKTKKSQSKDNWSTIKIFSSDEKFVRNRFTSSNRRRTNYCGWDISEKTRLFNIFNTQRLD